MRGIPGLAFEFPGPGPDADGRFACVARAAGVVLRVAFHLRAPGGPGLDVRETWALSPPAVRGDTTYFEAAFREPADVALAFRVTADGVPLAFWPGA